MAQTVQTRITAAEYAKMPETNKPMELIEGEVVAMPSPKPIHQRILLHIVNLVQPVMKGGEVYFAPMDVHLDQYNVVQPDLFWVSGSNSKCKIGDDGYWHGAPDLVVEIISEGTGRRDRREKFTLYEKHGSREYWLVDPVTKLVEVWVLTKGKLTRQGVYVEEEAFKSPVLGGAEIALKDVFK